MSRALRHPAAHGDARSGAASASASTRTPRCCTTWGLSDDVAGLETFARTVVEAVAPEVGVVKPQSAFFERFGSRGVAVLERVVADSRAAGALVLLDVKRGDIGSTSQAYADAYLDPASPLASDAITASPYLGFGSLDPMVETARRHGAGVFVLALTSNKEGPEVQHAVTGDGHRRRHRARPPALAQRRRWRPFGDLGAVDRRDHRRDRRGPRLQRPRPRARASAPRAAPSPTCGGSSARSPAACCRARRARCSPPAPTSPRCATRPGAATTPCARSGTREAPRARPRGGAAGPRGARDRLQQPAGDLLPGRRGAPGRAERRRRQRRAGARSSTRSTPTATCAARRPSDIADDWTQVVTRCDALQEALDDADVDPSSYDPGTTPGDLAGDDRRAIEAAARDARPARDRRRRWAGSSSTRSTCAGRR